jgi:hypothetical protein
MKNTLFTVIIVISSLLIGLGCTNDPKDNLIDYVERTEAQRDTVLELEEGTVVDVSGTFYFTISAVIAKALPLQFIATTEFVETDTGGTLDITLQPLSLDIQQTETPREMVGDPIVLPTIEVDDVGGFEVDLGTVFLVGAANPISGSDIEAELWLKGTIISEDLICGGVKGDIVQPIKAPLDYGNSSFAAKRLADDEEYPAFENMLLGCPSTDEEEGGEATEEEGGETSFEFLGDFEDNTYMVGLTVTEESWTEASMDQTGEFAYTIAHNIVSFDNEENWVIVESGWEPGTYDLVVYVEEPSVGGFYACMASLGNETMEDAMEADLSMVDLLNPTGETSCGGGFPFTLWEGAPNE